MFAQQGLIPTYGVERVRQLITALQPSGQILLLRVRAPGGAVVATGLVVGSGQTAVNWGAAFMRSDAELHPIQLFWWEAIRHWRDRGTVLYDMGGGGDYKARYGGVAVPTAHFLRSRYRILRLGRNGIRRLVSARQAMYGIGSRLAAPRVGTSNRDRSQIE